MAQARSKCVDRHVQMALQAGMRSSVTCCALYMKMSQHVAAHCSMAQLNVTCASGEQRKIAKPKPAYSTAQSTTPWHSAAGHSMAEIMGQHATAGPPWHFIYILTCIVATANT